MRGRNLRFKSPRNHCDSVKIYTRTLEAFYRQVKCCVKSFHSLRLRSTNRMANIFLSIKPIYAQKILVGEKTIELRKFRPAVDINTLVFLYATFPEQKIMGFFHADTVITDSPARLWKKYRNVAGVSKADYDQYFLSSALAHGILVKKAVALKETVSLKMLREIEPDFRPPQGYAYLEPPRKLAMVLEVLARMGTETK